MTDVRGHPPHNRIMVMRKIALRFWPRSGPYATCIPVGSRLPPFVQRGEARGAGACI